MKKLNINEWIAVVVACSIVIYFFFFSGAQSFTTDSLNPLNNNSQRTATTSMDTTNSPSGIIITDTLVGNGAEAVAGKTVTVHYTGKFQDGKVFDSSIPRGEPFVFNLGAGQVIKGWDEGVLGMKVGGKRTLTISPEKAYGANGVPGAIPPNSTLIFDVELLGVN